MGVSVQNAEKRHFKKWPVLGISVPSEVGAVLQLTLRIDTLKSWITKRIIWLMPYARIVFNNCYNRSSTKQGMIFSESNNGIVHF
ncbi:MAG: hypothetical protein IPP15_07000 [Saprospiraceae bacterium]|uniref:Uncharacterized protein n=1 Tax=Candidatus Opimibacter skivensis TaxID=2982028 RepID=A0A9D7SU76_9BACT|nr:hypothetical protein [Candidatus Opimibacter skivensis]